MAIGSHECIRHAMAVHGMLRMSGWVAGRCSPTFPISPRFGFASAVRVWFPCGVRSQRHESQAFLHRRGLPFSTTSEELGTLTVVTDRDTGHSHGFGFTEMTTSEATDEVINPVARRADAARRGVQAGQLVRQQRSHRAVPGLAAHDTH
jgi:hypothetical protein